MQKPQKLVRSDTSSILAEHFSVKGPTLSLEGGWRSQSNLAKKVFLIENHDEAFYIWRDAKVTQRVLVHIDAHHDMWWANDQATITIANFICPALKQDFVREVTWVVPVASFADYKSKNALVAQVCALLKDYPVKSQKPIVENGRITASVLGKKLIVCTIRSIPNFEEKVLLDIDVDYLVIPRVTYGGYDHHTLLPWCWPGELINSLGGLQSDVITVAYSVQGGYTPLHWKYLGDELALRLKQPDESGCRLEGIENIRLGAEAEVRDDTTQAELKYRAAIDLLPDFAAPSYRLARLLMRLSRMQEAQQIYRKAVDLDRSYGGPYSSAGFHFYWNRQFETAELEFRNMQALHPGDAYTHLGLALLAKERKLWNEAERHLRAALRMDKCIIDAQHALGDVLMKAGKNNEAIKAYEQALKLGLRGHKPLLGPILTKIGTNKVLDPWHCNAYARLATLYEHKGATAKALDALRISIAGGLDDVMSHLRLAHLYIKQRCLRNAVAELWQALEASPKDAWRRWAVLRQQLGTFYRRTS